MIYKGTPAAPGIAVGNVLKYCTNWIEPEERTIPEKEIKLGLARFEDVKVRVHQELTELVALISQQDSQQAEIFEAQKDILDDNEMNAEILEEVNEKRYSPEYALSLVFGRYAAMLDRAKNPVIRERAADIRDVRNRFLNCWFDRRNTSLTELREPVIVAAHDLLPSETAGLNKEYVLGIAGEVGGSTSHTAILARGLGIPAVLGIENLLSLIEDDQQIVLDGLKGELILSPSETVKATYQERALCYGNRRRESDAFEHITGRTADGERVDILMNLAAPDDEILSREPIVDGVGLFRTEFLYLGKNKLPDERESYLAYQKVLKTFGHKPVTIRTMDIGGDKCLDCLSLRQETNPFLGLRAIRLCLKDRDLFRVQLRAVLRAGTDGNLQIMLPMISNLEEIIQVKKILSEVKAELAEGGEAFAANPQLGIMIEVPSIALIADLAAEETDFASIGTNDLCQYLMAADRLNPDVAECYQSFHPALFRLIAQVKEAYHLRGKPVSVCGSMAGNPMFAAVLIGLGIRKLSMDVTEVGEMKRFLSLLTTEHAQKLADRVLTLPTAQSVEEYLQEQMELLGYSSYYAI